MNRFARWGFALVVLPVAACASNPPPAPPAPAPAGPPPLAAADASFIMQAAQGGLAEIQAAQLAQTTSHSTKVKSYAAKMISDHTQADNQLTQIATAKGATVPTAPNDMQTQQFTALQADKGHKFDHDYIAGQITDHTMMVQLFQTEAQSGTDPDLKKFASDTLPIIQSHLDMANHMESHAMHKAMRHHHTAS